MTKYELKELRDFVRLGAAEDYTHKPSDYIYTLRKLEIVGYSSGPAASTVGSLKTPKPAHGTPLSDVVPIWLCCVGEGGTRHDGK